MYDLNISPIADIASITIFNNEKAYSTVPVYIIRHAIAQ